MAEVRTGMPVSTNGAATPSWDLRGVRWWLFAAGEAGEKWDDFRDRGFLAHRGSGLGDLREFKTVEAIKQGIAALRGESPSPAINAARCWDSAHAMARGDVLVAKRGRDTILGVGQIVSDYEFWPNEDTYRHVRRVEWLWTGEHTLSKGDQLLPQKTITELQWESPIRAVIDTILKDAGVEVVQNGPLRVDGVYTRAQVRALLGLPEAKGGMWDTGYVEHDGEWYLFPNVGVPGRTGHDYVNEWHNGRQQLRWYGKTNTRRGQPAIERLLDPNAIVHLFTRDTERGPFTYHGVVTRAKVEDTTPVVVWWQTRPTHVVSSNPVIADTDEEASYAEGATKVVSAKAIERNRKARERCKELLGVACKVCGVVLEQVYGEIARGFIHVHHLRSIAEVGEEHEIDPQTDLQPVCPNCHAIIHLRRPHLTMEEARDLLARVQSARGQRGSHDQHKADMNSSGSDVKDA